MAGTRETTVTVTWEAALRLSSDGGADEEAKLEETEVEETGKEEEAVAGR